MGTTTIVEENAVETRKGVRRETDTTREIETEADSVMHTGAGIAGTQTMETTRETEIKTFRVAETGTEMETGTGEAPETGSTR